MNTARAHIKLQVWEWIPDQVASACQVIVYDPDTIMPVHEGWTSMGGFLEFDLDPGVYVIWVVGHNPMGYRPFLADTWIPIALLPGQTQEVCAALVSLIDIPVLYNAIQAWTQWKPTTFAELLNQYAQGALKECNATAIQQREALRKEVGTLEEGVIRPVEAAVDIRRKLLERRREWAEQVVRAAQEHAPQAVAEAEDVGRIVVETMQKRMGAAPTTGCCSELGGVSLDFSALPFPAGPLPPVFTFGGVEFVQIFEEIQFHNGSLFCYGSEESPKGSGTWYPATVKLYFGMLPCRVCKIVADVDGHGVEARLEGYLQDGTTQIAVCHDRQTLTLTADPGNLFISAMLIGAEAGLFGMHLE
jgi:hypothetical protein